MRVSDDGLAPVSTLALGTDTYANLAWESASSNGVQGTYAGNTFVGGADSNTAGRFLVVNLPDAAARNAFVAAIGGLDAIANGFAAFSAGAMNFTLTEADGDSVTFSASGFAQHWSTSTTRLLLATSGPNSHQADGVQYISGSGTATTGGATLTAGAGNDEEALLVSSDAWHLATSGQSLWLNGDWVFQNQVQDIVDRTDTILLEAPAIGSPQGIRIGMCSHPGHPYTTRYIKKISWNVGDILDVAGNSTNSSVVIADPYAEYEYSYCKFHSEAVIKLVGNATDTDFLPESLAELLAYTFKSSKRISVDLVTVNGTTTVGTVHEVPTSEWMGDPIVPELTDTAAVDSPKSKLLVLWIILALVGAAVLVGGILYTQRDQDGTPGSAEEGDATAMVVMDRVAENVVYEAGPAVDAAAPYGAAESKQGAEVFDGFNDGSANA